MYNIDSNIISRIMRGGAPKSFSVSLKQETRGFLPSDKAVRKTAVFYSKRVISLRRLFLSTGKPVVRNNNKKCRSYPEKIASENIMMSKSITCLTGYFLKAAVIALSIFAVAVGVFYASGVSACGTCCFDDDCGAGNECVGTGGSTYCRKIVPPCTSICTPGTTKCADDVYYNDCVKGSNGCYTWSYPKKCSGGYVCDNWIKSSTFGTCQPECQNECTVGQKACASGTAYKYCGLNGKSCFQWIAVECGAGKKCESGECVASCNNECTSGAKRCANGKVETCGNYDTDTCTEWGCAADCPSGQVCSGSGQCISTCTDECSLGDKRCASGGGVEGCGHFDSDSCLDWGGTVMCASGQTCSNGQCGCTSHTKKQCDGNNLYWYDSCNNKQELYQDCGVSLWTENYRCSADWTQRERINRGCSYQQCTETREWVNQDNCALTNKKCDGAQCVTKCTNECSTAGAKRCSSGQVQTCGNYDLDECLEWGGNQNCATGSVCQGDGVCEHTAKPVSVDLTGPSSVVCQAGFTLTWTSTNATSCTASGAWSGVKAVSGSEALGTIDAPKTYTLNCTGEDGSATDSVTVTVSGNLPTANAGQDLEIYESGSTTLSGSATGSDLTYAWTCNGGSVENASSANATFKASTVTQDTYYVCTLKVTNSCGSGTDTMNVLVKNKADIGLDATLTTSTKTGCAPIKKDSLTAEATLTGGNASDEITYYFDCTNDGTYEKTITTTARKYTAADLCDYTATSDYTAAVKTTALGLTDTATAIVSAIRCGGGGGSNTPSVSLSGKPDNGCAPLNGVDLYAELSTRGHDSDEYTYYFSCDGDGDWDKTVTVSTETYTAKDLCDYSKSGTYKPYVKVVSDNGEINVKDNTTISVESCGSTQKGNVSIDKLVSNLSNGTAYSDSVAAAPGDVVSFKIKVEASGGNLKNVVLTDILPNGISNAQGIAVDGTRISDNLVSGIDLGNIDSGDSKTITFNAYVASKDNFNFGQTVLTNTAKATCDTNSCSDSDTATVSVSKTMVQGATTVSTGFTNNPFIDSFVIPAGVALFLIWAFKAKLIKFEEWLDQKKRNYLVYKSRKVLDLQRAKLKAQKITDRFV